MEKIRLQVMREIKYCKINVFRGIVPEPRHGHSAVTSKNFHIIERE